MCNLFFESLESRTLLAGVTIIANTWDSTLGTYVLGTDNNMIARMGGGQNDPQYTIAIGANASTNALEITSFSHNSATGTNLNSPIDQIVFTIDYSGGPTNPVSTNPAYPLTTIASLVTDFMQTHVVDGINLASVPIHLMGVSRSSVLMDDIAQSLGQAGIWVDDETYMDPHPLPGNDPNNILYDNVAFADDYWRTSGQPEVEPQYNGHAVDGAYNQELTYVQADPDNYPTTHVAPSGYYNATIDLNSTTEFGPGYNAPAPADWWGTTAAQPPRDKTGFYYSDYVGGTRPLSGVWIQGGGSGVRTATVQSGTQWPNVTALAATPATTFFSGDPITLKYLHQDRGATSTVTFSLDKDQNPINNNDAVASLGTATFAASASPANDQIALATTGVAPGTYYLRATITDGQGHTRYAYMQPFTIMQRTVQIASAAAASTPVITKDSTRLSVLGGGPIAESNLVYTWTAMRAPGGAPAAVFSANGTNAAKSLTVKLGKDGSYRFRCTITDSADSAIPAAVSDVSVTVQQTATALRASPHEAKVKIHKTLRFTTTVLDQFNHPMRTPPAIHYSIASGRGSIGSVSGTFKASPKAGRVEVDIEVDKLTAMLGVVVVV